MSGKKSCMCCGYDGGWRNLYYCKAPHCDAFGIFVCEKCVKKLQDAVFGSKKYAPGFFNTNLLCPTCRIGEMGYETN